VEITCGVDWAEDHHDVAVMDDQGRVLASGRIGVDVAGYSELIALIVEHGGSAADTPVAIETDKNLLVLALRASGFTVYPINPRAVARYRERHHQAGKKSDMLTELPGRSVERCVQGVAGPASFAARDQRWRRAAGVRAGGAAAGVARGDRGSVPAVPAR